MSTPAVGTDIPPLGKTRLITSASDPIQFTANGETDARSAITRGLAEYLEHLQRDLVGGRQVRFKRVEDQYAEPEKQARYPSVAIYTTEAGTYDSSKFTPAVSTKCRLPPPDGRYLVSPADFVQELSVEIWATDPPERAGLVAMVEDAFNPVTYTYGFTLELPFYFNQRATYEMTELVYTDSDEDAIRRYRRATFTLNARVPLTKLYSFPDGKPVFQLGAIGSDASVLLIVEVT